MSDAGRDTEGSPEPVNLASHRFGLRHLRQTQDMLFERLAAAIEREYDNAHDAIAPEPEQRRMEVVQGLLAEEPVGFVELAELDYDLDASWHLATGTGPTLARVKLHLACQLSLIAQGETLWIWLGAPHKLDEAHVERLLLDRNVWGSLALGEARRGLEGWRQTHREAKGARALALRRPGTIVRYADVPQLAATVENKTLTTWLTELLMPLRSRPDGGVPLLETLRAYIDAERNCSSAAAMLGVRRQTVTNRLRTVEELLGRELRISCLGNLDIALRLAELAV
jgi:PucR C-terminal helix-turn-helix domain